MISEALWAVGISATVLVGMVNSYQRGRASVTTPRDCTIERQTIQTLDETATIQKRTIESMERTISYQQQTIELLKLQQVSR